MLAVFSTENRSSIFRVGNVMANMFYHHKMRISTKFRFCGILKSRTRCRTPSNWKSRM